MSILGCGWPESVKIRRADFITVNRVSHLGHTSYSLPLLPSNSLPAVSNTDRILFKDSCDNGVQVRHSSLTTGDLQLNILITYTHTYTYKVYNSPVFNSKLVFLYILIEDSVIYGRTHCVLNVRNELPAYIILQKWPFSIECRFICHAGQNELHVRYMRKHTQRTP